MTTGATAGDAAAGGTGDATVGSVPGRAAGSGPGGTAGSGPGGTGRLTGRTVLRGALTGQWRMAAFGSLLAAAHQAGEAMVPVVVGVVVDQAVGDGDAGALAGWIAALAGVFCVLSLSYRFSFRAAEGAAERAAHELRTTVTARVLHPRGGAETGRLPGELVNIAAADTKRVGAALGALAAGFASIAGLVTGGIALLRVSVPLGLLVLLGIPPLLVAARFLGGPLERRSEIEQDRAARASGVAADLVAGLRVLKGIRAEPAAVERYRRTSRDSLAASLRAARAKAWHDGAMLTLTGLFLALVALVGGRLAASGSITVGQLVAAVGLAQFLLTPLLILAWVNGEVAQGRASAARIAAVLSSPPAITGGTGTLPPGPVRGAVRLDDVTSGALRGLTLEAAPGELLGVVVADPAAAAALPRLLGRFADPESGTITIDGVALRTLDPVEVRRAILVVDHDAELFEGTLRGNIAGPATDGVDVEAAEPSGGSTATGSGPAAERRDTAATAVTTVEPAVEPAAVTAAIAAAAVDQVAEVSPAGLDTLVGERGGTLSGGQRQRVVLGRALAAAPPVLVLHDPTTAVDAVTEARIAEGIKAVRRGRTTLVVATSPALLAVTDRVMLLDGGPPVEGRHAALLRDDARYQAVVLA